MGEKDSKRLKYHQVIIVIFGKESKKAPPPQFQEYILEYTRRQQSRILFLPS
jgi:hypothetical protein